MRVMPRQRFVALAVVVLSSIGLGFIALPYLRGLSFLVRAVDTQGTIRTLADLGARRVTEREIEFDVPPNARAGRPGKMTGHLYLPDGTPRRAVLLVPEPHPAGISEPRLVRLAHELAASGLAVVTPDIQQLSRLDMSAAVTDEIDAAALWLSTRSDIVTASGKDTRVGLIGLGFSGGFSLVAAGRLSLADRVAYVAALGADDDLPRVLRYFCTGIKSAPERELQIRRDAAVDDRDVADTDQDTGKPDQSRVVSPQMKGLTVMLMGLADRQVPRPQVDRLRGALRRFLAASSIERADQPQADGEFASLKVAAKGLPEPSATLLRYVNNRDVVHLGARLLPSINLYGGAPSLSLSKSAKPAAPVFLLQGTADLVPVVESEYLVNDLRGHAPVRLLSSDFLSRIKTGETMPIGETLNLASFWGDLVSR